jgi:multimeric flavodoxin WrbA
MKVVAINGSPRKKWNTADLLNKVLEGAASEGADTKLIHLYDLKYRGCISCFACKKKDGKSYGQCVMDDDLSAVLAKIKKADAVVLGSPIYLANITGQMKSLLERMIFQSMLYDKDHSSLVEKKKPVAFIYTMNVNDERAQDYDYIYKMNERYLKHVFGYAESLLSTDTYQFSDYKKYDTSLFDSEAKAKRHEDVFPQDCERAFALGAKLVRTRLEDL